MAISVNSVRDVADGTQGGQFEVGDRSQLASLSDLDPLYRQLLDTPVTGLFPDEGVGRPGASVRR